MASQALATPAANAARSPDTQVPEVLVVDGDSRSVSHCSEMLVELGYQHHGTHSSRQALELLHARPGIQIVLANVDLPSLDGFALIEEARVRSGGSRAIAAVMITERATTEMAIRGLHVEAVDLLSKPLSFDAYSVALRRAMRYLAARRPAPDSAAMSDFGQQLSRLVAAMEVNNGSAPAEGKGSEPEIAATLRRIIGSRSLRSRHFPSDLFADPAWDILLDLTRAELEGQQVSVSSVCIAASVPMSTALRWVRQMTDSGLLRRWTDPRDRRRDLIALTPSSWANMKDYLMAVDVLHKRI